jgi:hypothetical protein
VKVAQSQLRPTTPKITLDLYAQAVSTDQQGSAQERSSDDASDSIFGAIETAKSCGGKVETTFSIVLGVQGYPNSTLPKSAKCFVSAAGFEPATHALKASPN